MTAKAFRRSQATRPRQLTLLLVIHCRKCPHRSQRYTNDPVGQCRISRKADSTYARSMPKTLLDCNLHRWILPLISSFATSKSDFTHPFKVAHGFESRWGALEIWPKSFIVWTFVLPGATKSYASNHENHCFQPVNAQLCQTANWLRRRRRHTQLTESETGGLPKSANHCHLFNIKLVTTNPNFETHKICYAEIPELELHE